MTFPGLREIARDPPACLSGAVEYGRPMVRRLAGRPKPFLSTATSLPPGFGAERDDSAELAVLRPNAPSATLPPNDS